MAAALASVQPAARRPFASLNGDRLRNLTNVKNRQNAYQITHASPLKRPRSQEEQPELDLENIDPDLKSSPKRVKASTGFCLNPSKPSHFVLKPAPSAPVSEVRSANPPSRGPTPLGSNNLPLPPSGRSPKNKRAGILSRRRVTSSPFTRIDPPSNGTLGSGSNGLPFSIDAALSRTVPSYAPEVIRSTALSLEESVPRGWLFDIHEDTPEEELGNLVEFSTQTLDISDDEGKAEEQEKRGKENIPPSEMSPHAGLSSDPTVEATAATRVSRKDMMTEDVRAPLGDLDARSFYAEGCDATSVVVVSEERTSSELDNSPFAFNTMAKEGISVPSPVESLTGNQDAWKDLLAQVDRSDKCATNTTRSEIPAGTTSQQKDDDASFDIWESGSAKEDGEVF